MFDSRASRTARVEGAETAATIGNPASERLLDDLERDTAGDQQHVVVKRQPAVHRGAAHELVDRVVAADVLTQDPRACRSCRTGAAA